MRNRLFAGAALAAAALTVLPALPASAASPAVLTVGSAGGSAVAVGDVLTASLSSGTIATMYSTAAGGTGVKCSSSAFSATVVSNPTAPGTAVETLTSQTFGNCSTVNVPGVLGVNSLTVNNLSYTNSVSDSAGNPATLSPGTAGPIQTTVVLRTLLGTVTCKYQASPGSLSGTTSNTTQSISFTNQTFTLTSGPGTCFANGYFTAAYSPVTDSTQGGAKVFVN
ncbi:Tat pathway signal sequence domain protein [Streptomyces tateyamensis]|uniref:Tat pathway signal sequence domain protein n=1 Tax=Streptomyces tateyamensis TaxID=565073 RepID=A0A2V4NG84_9ACTN|nr:Tat pathway signal sequence domain protein [Streptomyces tateyamensis]PYC84051.1 Tat pathway signal sequence domain protein [Streptomyces tateyamensis]